MTLGEIERKKREKEKNSQDDPGRERREKRIRIK